MPSLVKVFPLILAASVLANPFALREQDVCRSAIRYYDPILNLCSAFLGTIQMRSCW